MKSVFDELSLKDRQALARLYEMDEYKALRNAIKLLRINAATRALDATSFEEVKHLQGQAQGLKLLHLQLKELNKISQD